MPKHLSGNYFVFNARIANRPWRVETVKGALTVFALNRMSGIIAGIDAEFLHPGQESRAVHAHARGGSVGPAHSSLRFGERPHDLIPLFLVCSSAALLLACSA